MSDYISNIVNRFMIGAQQGISNNSYVQQLDKKLQEIQSNPTVQKANQATEQTMQEGRQAMQNFSQKASDKILETVLTQDQQKAMLDRKIAAAQEQIAANNQQLVRQPVQMEREFTNEQDKQDYINSKEVSDMRAKFNIQNANKDMDVFLQKVYDRITKKATK